MGLYQAGAAADIRAVKVEVQALTNRDNEFRAGMTAFALQLDRDMSRLAAQLKSQSQDIQNQMMTLQDLCQENHEYLRAKYEVAGRAFGNIESAYRLILQNQKTLDEQVKKVNSAYHIVVDEIYKLHGLPPPVRPVPAVRQAAHPDLLTEAMYEYASLPQYARMPPWPRTGLPTPW
jgi:archaellum component FlaC